MIIFASVKFKILIFQEIGIKDSRYFLDPLCEGASFFIIYKMKVFDREFEPFCSTTAQKVLVVFNILVYKKVRFGG